MSANQALVFSRIEGKIQVLAGFWEDRSITYTYSLFSEHVNESIEVAVTYNHLFLFGRHLRQVCTTSGAPAWVSKSFETYFATTNLA